jgi:hypothetical protein
VTTKAAYTAVTYVGVDGRGTARTGTVQGDSETFVESRFAAGWRRLQLTRDGVCIGIIGRRGGRRIWWAEAGARPDPSASGATS